MKDKSLMVLPVLGALLLMESSIARAGDVFWTGNSGQWDVGANWDTGSQPIPDDRVFITQSDSTDRVVSYYNLLYNTPSDSFRYLTIDATGAGSLSFEHNENHALYVNGLSVGTYGNNASYVLNTGSLNVIPGSSGFNGDEYIGFHGAGSFIQNGGSHLISGALRLGDQTGSSGYYELNQGDLSVDSVYVGGLWADGGDFTQTGGIHSITSDLRIGNNFSSNTNSTYSLSGGLLTVGGHTYAGSNGIGTFIQSGGTHQVGGYLAVGQSRNSNYVLSNGDLVVGQNLALRGALSSTFTQTGGNASIGSDLEIGTNDSYTLAAGTLNVGGNITGNQIGSGSGALILDGGNLAVAGGSISVNTLRLGKNSNNHVSFSLNAGESLSVVNEIIGENGSARFTQNGGSHTANTIEIKAGGDFAFNGGRLGVNAFIGDLQNNGGELLVGGGLSGTTTISGNFGQSNTSILDIQLGGLLAGIEHDVLNISGEAFLSGELDISLLGNYEYDPLQGIWEYKEFNPFVGDTFDILTADLISGNFDLFNFPELGGGKGWQLDFLFDEIGDTDIARLSVVSAVPIPAAVWLFGTGLLTLVGVARRKAS